MDRNEPLLLHEEMLLIALRDREGKPVFGANWRFALAGALLAELLVRGDVEVVEERRKRFARAFRRSGTEDELLDDCLQRIAGSKRRQTLQTWVQRFSNTSGLLHRAVRGLCRRGVLRADEKTVLGLFRRRVYPEVDPRPERELVERLRRAIQGRERDVDPRTAVLVSLSKSTDLLGQVLDRKLLKTHRQRIESIANGDAVGAATSEAIKAVQAAILVACIVPVIVSTST